MAEIAPLIEAFNRLHDGRLPAWPKLGFTLETGKAELETCFAQVDVYGGQRGVLRITEAAPLVACITSVGSPDTPTKAKLLEYVKALISCQGAMLVHTQSGLFVAQT